MSNTGLFHRTNLQAGELDIYLKPKTVKPETPFNSDLIRKNHYELIDVTNCEDENFIRIQNARSIYEQNSSDSNVKTHFISSVTYIENEAIEKSFEDCQKSYKKHGISWEEDYLFHGTDKTKVDSIFSRNFDIESIPVHGRTKVRTRTVSQQSPKQVKLV